MGGCDIPYDIDFSPLNGLSAKRIVLQLPDGLKAYAPCIAEVIRGKTGATVYISGDSTFGSCDLEWPSYYLILGADVIVHVGHTPYPRSLAHAGVEPPGSPRIVYLPARSTLGLPEDLLEKAAGEVRVRGWRRLVLTATAQHVHLLSRLKEAFESKGVEAVIPLAEPPYFEEGQVIGCDYRLPRRVEGDAYVIVAGGVFHALGLFLSTLKPIMQIDPYRREVVDRTREFEKFYAARLYKVSQAMNARRWGVVVGLKTGQYRPWLADKIVKLIESRGGEYLLYTVEYFDVDRIRTIDSSRVDAWVVTSCPRIPLDDLHDYPKPVLTPGEARMALQGTLSPYLFPW